MPKPKTTDSKTGSKQGAPYVTTETSNGQTFELTCFEPMHPFDILRAKRIKVIAFDDEGKILAIRKQKKIDIISGTTGCDDRNARMLRGVRPERKRTSRLDGCIWLP